jgi:hypothetical protein
VAGQRVNAGYKGLIIKGGKKIVVKWKKWEPLSFPNVNNLNRRQED